MAIIIFIIAFIFLLLVELLVKLDINQSTRAGRKEKKKPLTFNELLTFEELLEDNEEEGGED